MRAMIIAVHGGPVVFQEREVGPPAEPGPDEMRVFGSSVNPADAGTRRGMFPGPLPSIPV